MNSIIFVKVNTEIVQELLTEFNKNGSARRWNALAILCAEDDRYLKGLIEIICNEDNRLADQAGAVLNRIMENAPRLIEPFNDQLVELLSKSSRDGVLRSILRVYQTLEVNDELEGMLIQHSINFISEPRSAIAVKAFSMGILNKACRKYPELLNEVKAIVQEQIEYSSPGIRSRARNYGFLEPIY